MKKNITKFKMDFALRKEIIKFQLLNKETSVAYVLFIINSILISYLACIFLKFFCINFDIKEYQELYQNTGIALIGLSAIIFTLQIFNQEIKNEYMNSVMTKIIDTKLQHKIQYIYLSFLTILFILIPYITIFSNYIQFFVVFYFLSLIIVLIMFGMELFISIEKTNKTKLIKEIEERCIYILDMIERQYNIIDEYCKKNKFANGHKLQYIEKYNSIFIAYIQCVNLIIRNSMNDPILFTSGMESYMKIVKQRLEKRRNSFNYINIPFLSEVLPTKDNDSFIENYILEYLDEYSSLALDGRNRDIFSIIQNTYFSILIVGKDNKYVDSEELELTVKVVFSYYLKFLKYIIKFNNENFLFESIEYFKKIFVTHYECFCGLIDISFVDEIKEMSKLSIENKNLMNFRNIQGLLVIPIFSILNSADDHKKYRLELLFETLKNNLLEFTLTKGLIKRKDDARMYLNYTLNTMEQYSYHNFLMQYFNQHINNEGHFINSTFINKDILEPFINFLADDLVVSCLLQLDKDNRFVTGINDVYFHLELISNIIIRLIASDEFKSNEKENVMLLRKCLSCIKKYAIKYENSNGMRMHEVDNFFETIFNQNQQKIQENPTINIMIFDSYINISKEMLIIGDLKISFEYYYTLINTIYNCCTVNQDEKVLNLIKWYIKIKDNEIEKLYEIYDDLINYRFYNDELDYNNKEKMKEIVKQELTEMLKSYNNEQINEVIKNLKLKINIKLSKTKKIEKIVEKQKNT